MQGKGKQFVPAGGRVMLAFPGGAGYGDPAERDEKMVRKDLIRGYISRHVAKQYYGMSDEEIAGVDAAVNNGEDC